MPVHVFPCNYIDIVPVYPVSWVQMVNQWDIESNPSANTYNNGCSLHEGSWEGAGHIGWAHWLGTLGIVLSSELMHPNVCAAMQHNNSLSLAVSVLSANWSWFCPICVRWWDKIALVTLNFSVLNERKWESLIFMKLLISLPQWNPEN